MTKQTRLILLVVLIALRFASSYDILSLPEMGLETKGPNISELFKEEPVDELKNQSKAILEKLKENGNADLCLDIALFYYEFADIVQRDEQHLLNKSSDFADYNSIALDLAFNKRDVPGIGNLIDEFFAEGISLEPEAELDRDEVVKRLYTIAWCAYEGI